MKTGGGLWDKGFGAREMFSTLAERQECLPTTEKLLHASSDLRSERMMSVKCGRPGEGKRLLFSSQSWLWADSVKLPITGCEAGWALNCSVQLLLGWIHTEAACHPTLLHSVPAHTNMNIQQQQNALLCSNMSIGLHLMNIFFINQSNNY